MAKSALKFKDSVAAYEKLAQEIAARRFAPVYLLMGEESYFIDAIAERLATTVLGEAERAFNQITVYGKDSEAGQVINLCRQMPMMGSYQVVILKEAQQLRGLDKLSLYTQKPSPTTILVICHKEKNADKRSAFYKGCAANGAVLESVRPRDYEIASWLQRFIAGKGLAIDTKALSMLTDHLGTDISKISNELGKLVVSLPEGTKRITDADIEANIGISKDYNNFELCKAVATRDMARALMIAEHFARNPKDNPLLVTVLALFGQFKELFVVNYLRWLSRHKGTAFPPDTELMRILKKSNVYVIGEIKQNAANWDNRKVFNILGLLREYDAKSKGMRCIGRRTAARTAAQNLHALMREVYLYQTVHVLDGECLCLREHLAVLDRWSRTLFGCPGPQDAREVGTAVAAVVGREAPGSDRSKFVRLVLPASGSLRLEFEGVSLYRGYDLRSLMPEAVTLQYEPPLFDAPTSAREAAVELARQYAGLQGASVAVRCDRNGTLMAADEAALFAIRGRRVYAPPGEASIGRSLAVRSIRAAGLELAASPVGRDDLPRMDELFFIDHRGVTALSRCDGQPYMAIFAERIAGALRGLFPNM